jgi:hypothetical protein
MARYGPFVRHRGWVHAEDTSPSCGKRFYMDISEPSTKVVIEQRNLRGSGDDDLVQKVATVYIDGDEYRVFAPPKAVGEALDWLDHFQVRQSSLGGEVAIVSSYATLVIERVKDELEKLRLEATAEVDMNRAEPYYHVRVFGIKSRDIEVKFDLRRADVEKRILEPYRNLRPIVLGGRTIPLQDLKRVEIFESPRPSSQFGEWASIIARRGDRDWFFGESDVKDVTDELITTPSLSVAPQETDAIELLCLRFHTVVRQLRDRREGRSTLDVTDEYDVQDLLHALLRIFFDDVRPEEWTPSYAGKSSRMDFLLPTEKLVVEVKKTRPSLDAKEVGSELIEDIARYRTHPSCKRLICFVYDPEGRIANPRGIEGDLSRNESGFEVKVIIAPRS